MSTNDPSAPSDRCPKCGAELNSGAFGGVCPACALEKLLGPPQPHREAVEAERGRVRVGERLGLYKILEEIGEGGCGTVYVAEQEEPVRRRVAVKVIKLGMDTREVIARFEAERQALAMMDHPNIARVLDAGSTDSGRPYFVMELVKGIRITDYCDRNQLSPEERLRLFIQVCHAIQHAHQKGIIHRDIKPANLLVALHDGVPVPKVIDFGIAKATSNQRLTDKTVYTAIWQFIGTPAYMSPEQAELSGLDIDTRSDVYSLGVLLYELLTGHTPFDARRLEEAGTDEVRRIIREDDPPRPSTRISTLSADEQILVAKRRKTEVPRLLGIVRGDLDWIVMKALEKDRTRRYGTANGLAADVLRYLGNEPVSARPPRTLYRFQKMVRRNRVAVAAVSAILAALMLGLGLSTWMYYRERSAARQANLATQEQTQLREQAEMERGRAESEGRQAKVNLAIAQIREASAMLREGNPHFALARLASVLRADTNNIIAANWITQLLVRRHWAMPETIQETPVRLDERFWLWEKVGFGPRLSPDGRYLLQFVYAAPDSSDVSIGKISPSVVETRSGRELVSGEKIGGAIVHPSLYCFSADSAWLSVQGRLLDLENGLLHDPANEGEEVPRRSSEPLSMSFSGTGKYFMICHRDSGVKVFRLTKGEKPALALRISCTPRFASISKDGNELVVADKQSIRWWDLDSRLIVRERPLPQDSENPWTVVGASDDLKWFVIRKNGKPSLALWPAGLDFRPIPLEETSGGAVGVDIRPDSGSVSLVYGDDTLTGTDLVGTEASAFGLDGRRLSKPIPFPSTPSSRMTSSGGQWSACVQTYSTGVPAVRISRHFIPFDSDVVVWDSKGCLAFSWQTGNRFRTMSRDGAITEWSVPWGGALYAPLTDIGFHYEELGFDVAAALVPALDAVNRYSPASETITVGIEDEVVLLGSAPEAGDLPRFGVPSGATELIFDDRGTRVAVGSPDGSIQVRATSDGSLESELSVEGQVLSLAFDSKGRRLAAVDESGIISIFDLEDESEPIHVGGEGRPIHRAIFNPDDGSLLALHTDRTVAVLDLNPVRELSSTQAPSPPICAAFSDGATFAIGCSGGEVIRYRWDGKKLVQAANGNLGEAVLKIDASRTAQRFLAVSEGGRLALSDLEDDGWRAVSLMPRIAENAEALGSGRRFARLSGDGRWIATAGDFGGLHLLDSTTGEPMCETFREGTRMWDGGLNAVSSKLVAIQHDRRMVSWELPCLGMSSPAWFAEFAEQIAGCRFDPRVGLVDVRRKVRKDLQAWIEGQPDSDYRRLARWFLEDLNTRPIVPGGTNTLKQRIQTQLQNDWPVHLSEALKLPATEGALLTEIAINQLNQGRSEEARVLGALATVRDPDKPDSWSSRLNCLTRKENLPEALWVAGRAISQFPTNAFLWLTQGRLMATAERWDDAFASLDHAAKLNSEDRTSNALRIRKAAVLQRAAVAKRASRPVDPGNSLPTVLHLAPRPTDVSAELVDLTDHYNASLTDDWHNPSDIGNNLRHLPTGIQSLGGIRWDVRGIVQLASSAINSWESGQPGYPEQVRGIRVSQSCRKLHFLHAVGWEASTDGVVTGRLSVKLADGSVHPIELEYGKNVRNWQFSPKGESTEKGVPMPVWKGPVESWKKFWPNWGVRLYHLEWTNPNPEVVVESVDFESTMSRSAPFLIAITAEP